MEVTKGPIEQEVAQEQQAQAAQEMTAEQQTRVQKLIKLMRAAQSGNLTFEQYKALPQRLQNQYKRRFGRPKTATELRGVENDIAARRRLSAVAHASRKVNQQRSA